MHSRFVKALIRHDEDVVLRCLDQGAEVDKVIEINGRAYSVLGYACQNGLKRVQAALIDMSKSGTRVIPRNGWANTFISITINEETFDRCKPVLVREYVGNKGALDSAIQNAKREFQAERN